MARAFVFAAVMVALPVATGCGGTTTPDAADGASLAPDAAGACINRDIQASNYDISCSVDSDCRAIAEGNTCSACALGCVATGTISVGALAQYMSDIANTPALVGVGDAGCPPCEGTVSGNANVGPFCCAGKCHMGSQCPDACPAFQSLPTCPAAPGAVDCARPTIGCGLDALPSGPCSTPAQCSALIYPCPDWQESIGGERADGYICSCTDGHWSCDDCNPGASLCTEAPDGAPLNPPPVVDAAAHADAETDGGASGGPCTTNSDCDAGERCLYRIGDCSAQGQCLSAASLGAECNIAVAYCGCNGTSVAGLCGPPYAFGPTLGRDASSGCDHTDAGDASAE